MKSKKNLVLSLLAIATSSFAQPKITLEDIWTKGTFAAKGVAGFNSMKDGNYYCAQDKSENIIRYSFSTGNMVDTIVKASDLLFEGTQIKDFRYQWNENETKLILETKIKPLYRHSYQATVFVYDVKSKNTKKAGDDLRLADLSPDGNKIAYVKLNNLCYYDLLNNTEVQVTKNGLVNQIINGATDWVYEEEFALSKGFYWNNTGDAIVYYEFNESAVPQYEMAMYGDLYPEQNKFKYPKAGEPNSTLHIYCYKLEEKTITSCDIGSDSDIYIPRLYWTKNNEIFIQRLNRLQNKLEFLLCNPNNGKSQVIYTEENKAYIEVPEISFLEDKKSILFTSEKSGWNHLYRFDLNSKSVIQLTNGNWDLDQVYGLSDKNKTLYYSSGELNPMERQIYAIGLDGKNKIQLSNKKGWNTATFNNNFSYFLLSHSSANTPSRYTLCDATGKEIRILEENSALNDKLKSYAISQVEMTTFTNAYQEKLNAFIIKPQNFDSGKKYPVLMYVYGGPGHQLAVNRWMGSNYIWFAMLAQKGYMVVCTDGRGTGFNGEAFKKVTYLQLGKYEIEDQIYVAKQLARLPYVDSARIGIWGWSYGGYMASLGITKGSDIFKTAIAVAPVTNWRYYDNIYTERFMRTPKENGNNYDINSPVKHVDKIKGNYLIIHGTADDNVHFQNTVEMVNAMINAGKKYDAEFYPNKNHGIGGGKTRLHLYDRMTRFILEKL